MVLTADTAATPLSRTKSVSDRLYAESALAFLNGFALVTFADQACHSRHHLKQMATSSPLAAVSEQGAELPQIVRRGDEENFPDAGKHDHRQRK